MNFLRASLVQQLDKPSQFASKRRISDDYSAKIDAPEEKRRRSYKLNVSAEAQKIKNVVFEKPIILENVNPLQIILI